MQTLTDKVAAIESLLPFLFAHLDHVPAAMRTARQGWISERSPLDDSPAPSPAYNLDCNGRCYTCQAYAQSIGRAPVCPPEEAWAATRGMLRRRYRLEDIEASLMRLSRFDPTLAQAVWAVWVEPWPDPKTEPISPEVQAQRAMLAEKGLDWLAWDIEGDVLAFGEKVEPRDNQIRQLAALGFPQKRIARELRCSLRDIQRVLTPSESAVGG
jgi:hypothetical protein